MSFFRSETMSYYQIVVPRESAWDVFNELGKIETIETVDMTPEEPQLSRPFYPMIKRCEDVLARFQLFEALMKEYRIKNTLCYDYKGFLQNFQAYCAEQDITEEKWFENLEQNLELKYGQLSEQIKNLENLTARQSHLFEYKAALLKSKEVLGATYYGKGRNIAINPSFGGEVQVGQLQKSFALSYLIGVVDRVDALKFKRMIFRATKGNSWVSTSNIEYNKIDSQLQEDEEAKQSGQIIQTQNIRTVFIVVYQGGASDFLKQKLNRICDSFSAAKFVLPEDPSQLMQKALEIDGQIDEGNNLVRLTQQTVRDILLSYASIQKSLGCSLLEVGRLAVVKEKSIFHNLNMLHLKHSIYTGFFWCPSAREFEVHQALQALSKRKQNVAPAQILEIEPPDDFTTPTHFKVNEFTWAFQEIVNTYGMARYKEVNPGLFAIVFFPFMFGIMFGDIGHGGLLLVVGVMMVKYVDVLKKNPEYEGLAVARYLFLLMGICAFYCGFIYNDFMSLPWNIFGSCFKSREDSLEYELIEGCVYPIGFDPKWYIASNELNFFNSFKMKFAVIFGVLQMSFGILLKGSNAIYFNNMTDFFCEFIPQIIFLVSTFGYMCLLIFIKWAQNWGEIGTQMAPSIINLMINIPLKNGSTDGQPLYNIETQEALQAKILSNLIFNFYSSVVAFICVPWMLIPKPLILLMQSKRPQQPKRSRQLQPKHEVAEPLLPITTSQKSDSKLAEELRRSLIRKKTLQEQKQREIELQEKQREEELKEQDQGEEQQIIPKQQSQSPVKVHSEQESHGRAPGGGHGGHGHGEFEFGEIFVHQIIETIEFVLGSISNTASYLRLWALSLAHGQLAKVFFSKCLGSGIQDGSILTLVIGWPVFMHCTLGVLMSMDVMECFLHALRLQWVEFQNKFYKADGVKFNPFSFVEVMKISRQTQ